jgi:oxygen-independent coproporphyrinogen-3 oxidase
VLYIHIPFCKQACSYCDFHFATSLTYREELVHSIIREIELRKYEINSPLQSIYFGGGTPSILEKHQLEAIFNAIISNFSISHEVEITLEANPDDLSLNHLKFLKSLGINRLSIGIQSFREEDLKFMHRAHTANEALNCVGLATRVGFERISIDLIYGTPGLSNTAWEEQLKIAASLNVNHLSCYALTVEENTPLAKQIRLGKMPQTDDELTAQQFGILQELSPELGFNHYEISNLSRGNSIAIHNSGYWSGDHYVGIGPSAHSFSGNSRRMNIANNQLYISGLKKGDCPHEIENIDTRTRYNELVLTGLRTKKGILLEDIRSLGTTYLTYFIQAISENSYASSISLDENRACLLPSEWLKADGISSNLFCLKDLN